MSYVSDRISQELGDVLAEELWARRLGFDSAADYWTATNETADEEAWQREEFLWGVVE